MEIKRRIATLDEAFASREELSDDDLILAMLGTDSALARIAKRIYDARHASDPVDLATQPEAQRLIDLAKQRPS